MKGKHWAGIAFWVLIFLVSCSKDIEFGTPISKLKFSADTLFMDTVFNQVRSETYDVKVYNTGDGDAMIPKISLEGGASSLYRINVDGRPGTEFTNIPLRAHDSLYIFVEIAPQTNVSQAIAEDRILFSTSSGDQHVTLFSVIEDADFYISTKDHPKVIAQNTVWDNSKAKVIFGDLTVADGKTLTIQKGTKVYFHKNSGLNISKNAQLIANGTLDQQVVFRGDRSDPRYDSLPANWNGIKVLDNAHIDFNYAKLQGGFTGLELHNATANLKNTIVQNFQNYGILGIGSKITGENLVMNNAGDATFGIFGGGTYQLIQSSLANYWPYATGGNADVLYVSNEYDDGSQKIFGALNLKLQNSILYSNRQNAINLQPADGQTFTYLIQNCLLNYDPNLTKFAFDGNPSILNSIKNEDPLFSNSGSQKLNLRLKKDSPAEGKGDGSVANAAPFDFSGVSRTTSPNLGAYQ